MFNMAKKRNKKKRVWSKKTIYERSDGVYVSMDSTWEHVCATKLDEAGIKWIRNPNMYFFYYAPTGVKKRYIPDFYLPDYDLYLEIKGFWTMQARHKMADVKRRHAVNILIVETMPDILRIAELVKEQCSNKETQNV